MKEINSIILFILITLLISCKDSNRQKSPDELKMELQMQESENPLQYLTLENVKKNKNKIKDAGIFSSAKYDGYLITGKVASTATIATYKDLNITVEFYSKTKSTIESKTFVFYEFYKPNSKKDFSIKINAPIAMDSYGVFVAGATPNY